MTNTTPELRLAAREDRFIASPRWQESQDGFWRRHGGGLVMIRATSEGFLPGAVVAGAWRWFGEPLPDEEAARRVLFREIDPAVQDRKAAEVAAARAAKAAEVLDESDRAFLRELREEAREDDLEARALARELARTLPPEDAADSELKQAIREAEAEEAEEVLKLRKAVGHFFTPLPIGTPELPRPRHG